MDARAKEMEARAKESAEEAARAAEKASRLSEAPRIAIVLDDWGYNIRNLKAALELEAPITFSILPNLPYSRRIARAAYDEGREVILHLPLEPHEDIPLEKNTLLVGMEEEEAAENFQSCIDSVPHLAGISNHMGSKATEDERLMSIVFKKMKAEDLYFLDSLVTSSSVCRRLSGASGIRFASRSVFLDNDADEEYIKGQIEELLDQAQATGSAIGVGHDRQNTIKVLAVMIPEIKSAGVQIVPASELAE
jgi:polysaccharide deacetylase 2 family uncharacterized protein YibQ